MLFQEREKAREERKKNLSEYRTFLESCNFIKVPFTMAFHTVAIEWDHPECVD
jgi:hypothetical protein